MDTKRPNLQHARAKFKQSHSEMRTKVTKGAKRDEAIKKNSDEVKADDRAGGSTWAQGSPALR